MVNQETINTLFGSPSLLGPNYFNNQSSLSYWRKIYKEQELQRLYGKNSTESHENEQENDEYFKATFIYFILCVLVILFFSMGLP